MYEEVSRADWVNGEGRGERSSGDAVLGARRSGLRSVALVRMSRGTRWITARRTLSGGRARKPE